ncbi:membrane-bound dehydrogenase [Fimbriiglobus ruber]|uniref:Membrane-bound dehydrogenase n=1 Tax=Fimbriiglobus ruber TaxID=1908690 RepID=A0A225D479_9BACT|nr:membrane-bound dehydrogenase [Fimbriiglobus ruber]
MLLGTSTRQVSAAELDLPYKVGVGKVDITPAHPIRLNGFGFRRTESAGTYQKIWVRALAIKPADQPPVVLLTVDVLGIPADVYGELVRRLGKDGLSRERLMIAATHTHTGPMLTGANPTLFGMPIAKDQQQHIDQYTAVFVNKLEEAARAALKDLRPARLEWGVGSVGFAMNRRTKGGVVDHDLPLLVVRGADKEIRAVYLNYACHAVTLSENKIGGDWPGYAGAALEDALPGATALVAVGCGADQNPNSGVTGAKEDVAAAQGRTVGAEVRRLVASPLTEVRGPITTRLTTLDLPLAALPTRAEWERRAQKTDYLGNHARVNLARLDRGEKLSTSISYPVQTWAFGDSLAMVHLAGEVVVDYSRRLKAELDGRRVWTTAYANAAPCYIPSERVLKEGGYEGGGAMWAYDQPAPFAPGLEDKIVAAVTGQIGKTFAATFNANKTGGTRPLSPHQSLALMRSRPGTRVELVAGEPLVADPVALAFGPDGKVWVAEMGDYPSGRTDGQFDPGGRVVVLQDRDGDGTLDTSTVFLDKLPFPTGLLPWRNGVLVCAAPDILYAEDTDGDGKADKVTKLYSGFGTQNYQARVNSLQYGLDGWVYGSCGLFGGNILCHRTGKTVALGDRDFRIKPDTGDLEPVTGRTQQGRVRDDQGNWFGCDNGTLIRHYAMDDHYLRRNPAVAFPNGSVGILDGDPRHLFPLKADAQRFALSGPPDTVTAACGVGIYRDDLLGPGFAGNSFTCEPVNLLVHRRQLHPHGTTFTASRAADETAGEFLASTDPWFRPVHAVTGPDGGIWVAAMYRFLIEHPRWVPPAELAKIDPRAGAGLGRIYRVCPEGRPLRRWERLDKFDTAGLVEALDSPNGWQRDAAMMQLVWKADPKSVPGLEKLLTGSPHPLARLQALCTLDQLGRLTPATITAVLGDKDPAVRRHAVRTAEARFADDRSLAPAVAKLAADPDAQVRLQVAYSLGAWTDPRAGEVLARIALASQDDPYPTAAAVSSLTATNLPIFATTVFQSAGPAGPPPALVRNFLATAAGADSGTALPALLGVVTKPTDGAFRPWQLTAAVGALDALERRGQPWAKLPADTQASLAPVVTYARKIVDTDATPDTLLAAIPLLAHDPTFLAADVKRLAGLLAATRPVPAQTAALTALARVHDAAVPPVLIAAWSGASPALRGRIIDTLLARPDWTTVLLTAAEKGTIPLGQVDAGRRQVLAAHPDAAIRARADKLLAGGSDPNRVKVIEASKPALALEGDRTRGKAVFARVCAACHLVDGVGTTVGPDLTALANKTPLYFLTEILDPNRNLDSRYAEYWATTTDGRTVSGVLAAETATGVTLRGQQGKEETILRTDLESLRGTTKSLMPEGLEKDLTHQNLADLLTYLTSTDRPHKVLAGNAPAEIVARDKKLTLPAARAFVYGGEITFESQFQNIGYWHTEGDAAVWKVKLDAAAEFDVYLDYACQADAAGNTFALDGAAAPVRGKVPSTGGWDKYTLWKLGTVRLPAGSNRLTARPDGPVRSALLDLRTIYLVPAGTRPTTETTPPEEPSLAPAELARLLLTSTTLAARRASLFRQAVPQAHLVIQAMTVDLPAGDAEEEYRRIPAVWQVAIAAGRANDTAVLRGILDVSLPKPGDPLRDWQAVVLGGGVVNGLSQKGLWPTARIAELLKDNAPLTTQWQAMLKQTHAMADAERVPAGTRYDALRLVALDGWDAAGPQLTKYLAKSANAELQMGAVSGLADVERREVATLLVKALPDLTPYNRGLAIAGLLRTPDRAAAVVAGLEAKAIDPKWLAPEQQAELRKHPDAAVRDRAARILGP